MIFSEENIRDNFNDGMVNEIVSDANAVAMLMFSDSDDERLKNIEQDMSSPEFWQSEQASERAALAGSLKRKREERDHLLTAIDDISVAQELAADDPDFFEEVLDAVLELNRKVIKAHDELLFSGEYDNGSAIVTLNPGEGGLEAQDFCRMIYDMYAAYAKNEKWKITVLDYVSDELSGAERICVQFDGLKAYGLLTNENGVHRLVRISPTDEKKRRHTSFASVEVMPVLPESAPVELDERDIVWDVYRSSGPGGQGVNTTDSAVRATHTPTGIVVTCQVERSQLMNKERARNMLRSKLWELQRQEEEAKRQGLAGEKSTSAWGHAIRSYVLYPYKLVRDERSGAKYTDADGIMSGNISEMLMDAKRWQAEMALN